VAAVVLLPALWSSLAVNAATPARRPRPSSARSRVSSGIPWAVQSHEATELLVGVLDEQRLFIPASDQGASDFPPAALSLDFPAEAEGRVTAFAQYLARFSVLLAVPPRGPPLV
jgi:hypothetical protein